MEGFLAVAWMIAGGLAGLVLGIALNPSGSRYRAERARAAALEGQQRRQIEKLKTAHEEVQAQLDAANHRHERQLDQLRQTHAIEMRAADEELRRVRDQLHRLAEAAEDSGGLLGTAFVATRIDDPLL